MMIFVFCCLWVGLGRSPIAEVAISPRSSTHTQRSPRHHLSLSSNRTLLTGMRIAVVGSGVAGLSATWVSQAGRCASSLVVDRGRTNVELISSSSLLSSVWLAQLLNEHSEHEVDLIEAGDYIGGHTHTVDYKRESADAAQA